MIGANVDYPLEKWMVQNIPGISFMVRSTGEILASSVEGEKLLKSLDTIDGMNIEEIIPSESWHELSQKASSYNEAKGHYWLKTPFHQINMEINIKKTDGFAHTSFILQMIESTGRESIESEFQEDMMALLATNPSLSVLVASIMKRFEKRFQKKTKSALILKDNEKLEFVKGINVPSNWKAILNSIPFSIYLNEENDQSLRSRCLYSENIEEDTRFKDQLSILRKAEISSIYSVPVFQLNERIGSLIIMFEVRTVLTKDEFNWLFNSGYLISLAAKQERVRKLFEMEIKKKIRVLLDSSFNAVLYINEENKVIEANSEAEVLYGLTESNYHKKGLSEVESTSNSGKTLLSFISQMLMNQNLDINGEKMETEIVNDYAVYQYEMNVIPMVGLNQENYGNIIVMKDVTLQKHSSAAIVNMTNMLGIVSEITPTAIVLMDSNGSVLRTNKSFRENFPQINFVPNQKLNHHDFSTNKNLNKYVTRALNGYSTNLRQVLFINQNKEEFYYNVNFEPIKDLNAKVIGAAAFFSNMTESFRMVEELNNAKSVVKNVLKIQKTLTFKYKKIEDTYKITFINGTVFNSDDQTKIIGSSVSSFLPEKYFDSKKEIFDRAWSGEEMILEELQFENKYIISISPLLRNGKVIEVMVSVTDVSHLKTIQNQLMEEKEKYKSLIKYSPESIILLDREGNITETNAMAREMFALNEEEMQATHISNLFQADQNEIDLYLLQSSSIEAKTFTISLPGTTGHLKDFVVTKTPINVNNELVGNFCIIRESTNEFIMKNELIEVKEIVESYFNQSSDVICLLDKDARILKVNAHFEKTFGWRADEIIGKSFAILYDKNQWKEYFDFFSKVKKGYHINGVEGIRFTKNQIPVHIMISSKPLHNIHHQLIGVSIIIKNLSAMKQTEDLLLKSEQLAMIGQLAAGVAHEIRNPLTTLKGFIQLFKEDSREVNYYDVILDELNRIETITNEFLALAKPQVVKLEICSLDKIVREAVEFMRMECLKNDVLLDLIVLEKMLINADKNQLKQVILNVIKNAIEAMNNGGKLTVELKMEAGHGVISVHDTGHGIDSTRLKHLGEPFYSTKEKGTGLGLMICQKIMKEHGGTLKIHSELNEGTTVKLSIPIIP